jgi:hypothetical protein
VAELGLLLDRAEILDVYSRYALGMDRGDRAMFASAWSADAVWTCAALGLDLTGHAAIMDCFDRRYASGPALPEPGGNLRLAGNHLVEVTGDRATGTAEMAAFRFTDDAMHLYTAGYYDDDFVRTGDGWRLSRRDMVVTPLAGTAR